MKLLQLFNLIVRQTRGSLLLSMPTRQSGTKPKLPSKFHITQPDLKNNLKLKKPATNLTNHKNSKFILFKDSHKQRMNTIYENFAAFWSKALIDPANAKSANCQVFHRVKLDASMVCDIEDFLKEEFYQAKSNIYELHLDLIEKCFGSEDYLNRLPSALFLNHAFINWHNQQRNINKRKLTELHLTSSCEENVCFCSKDAKIIERAFNLSLSRNVSMLSSFNKIYNFNENSHVLNVDIEQGLKELSIQDKAVLIGELQMQDKIDTEKIVIPLMIMDKYSSIDDFINKNENVLLKVVDLCNKLCGADVNLKEFSKSFSDVKSKKLDRFKAKIISKYAMVCLKKVKKTNLINTNYSNIAYQLNISQMRFLINQKYDKTNNETMSSDAWTELLIDLVETNDLLQTKLILELIHYQKDVETANSFLQIFGHEKHLKKLPESIREFYTKNIEIITKNIRNERKLVRSQSSDKYYYPHDFLPLERIKFLNQEMHMIEMLDYFKNKKPDIIGLDCEWKPSFNLYENESENDAKFRSSIFQIASRDFVFILDMKDLFNCLNETLLNEFANEILFNENLIKLGFNFEQDAKRLLVSFPMFKHRFSEFGDDVINMDEIVSDLAKKHAIFDESTNKEETNEKVKKIPKSLSDITKRCFGKSLNKSECMSNWERRPLREAQLRYAALDAFILIQIHDFIQGRCKHIGIVYDYTRKNNYL